MARRLLFLTIVTLLVNGLLNGQVSLVTNHYGHGAAINLSETTLTADNVNSTQFGRLHSYPVDGAVFAQPLYVPGLEINGTPRNVLYVATMNDKLYAFDADSPSPTPLWWRDFTSPPTVTAVPIADVVAGDVNGVANVGIQSTPVIDSATGTLYLLARTKENGSYVQRLHALDIHTGRSRVGSPVRITGSVAGTAPDSTLGPSGRRVTFDPKAQWQVTGLALSQGVVLIAWTPPDAAMSGHGWIMGYDATSLARVGIFCVTPDAKGGGIGQSGRAPTIDPAGNAYFATGKGAWDGTRNFGDSLLKFSISPRGMALVDYFTPNRHGTVNLDDDDLAGAGVTLLPGKNLVLGGGKDGGLYLLHSTNLGHRTPNDAQIVQRMPLVPGGAIGGPVFWDSPTSGPLVYHWSNDDVLKAYRLTGGRLVMPAHARGDGLSLPPRAPGGALTLSANGSTTGTGIIWATTRGPEGGMQGTGASILRAYDAETLIELWASDPNPTRNHAGPLIPFVQPVVADGKVYLAADDGTVAVYGLLPAVTPQVTLGPPTGSTMSTNPISASAESGAIGINFVGSHSVPMGAGEAAGVVAKPNWNNATGAVRGTGLALMDEFGAPTTATVTWSSSSTFLTPIADSAGNPRLMKGYLNTTDTSTTTVTVTGLPVRPYEVYVYADGDNAATRTGAYRIGGSGIAATTVNLTDLAGTNFSGTFTEAASTSGNYVKFTINASGFTLTASPGTTTDAKRRAPVNGIQIVPAPDATVTAAIGINFVGSHSAPMGAGEAAGVVAKPNWNNATGAVRGTGLALMDEFGAPTTATVTWSSSSTFLTPIADSAGNPRLMKGYLNTTDTSTTTVTVTGLSPRPYDIYVYADGDNAATRTGAYRISGSGIAATTVNLTDLAGTNFSGTFTEAASTSGNYVKFTINASGFTLTASPGTTTDAKRRAPVNGIQIVPAPDATVTAAIGINFVGSHSVPMGAGEAAGVVAKPNWNNAMGAVRGTGLALMDEFGAPTTATVTWSSSSTFLTPIADSAGNPRLMKGYLNTTDTSTTTVTVTGLPVRPYDIYVYADGDNAATRTGAYRISGSGIAATTVNLTDLAGTNFPGTFTEAASTSGNYVKFTINASGFTLTASPGTSTDAKRRAPVNGLQIVAGSQGPPVSLDPPITVEGLGAGQGVEVRDGRVYLYGDASTGIVREYDVVDNNMLRFTGRHIQLTAGGGDLVPHPTGLTVAPGLPTLLGNTVSQNGTILIIDWARALASGTLDGAVQATIADDLAVNGTRPEYVRVGQRWLVATADYGANANEVRLYDPEALKTAARTSEPGVLVHRFRSSPYVQTLHWLDGPGLLVLVQNKQDGQGWRLTVVDLARSIAAGAEQVTLTTDLAPSSELEGFHLLAPGRGLFLSSAPVSNVYFANVRLF